MLKKFNLIILGFCFLFIVLILKDYKFISTLNSNLILIMEERPLNNYYFPIFIILSLFSPLIIRISRLFIEYNYFIDIYLILLFVQIVNEYFSLILIGKGITVFVGLIFSCLRIYQIKLITDKLHINSFIKLNFIFLLLIWFFNIIQIIIRRIIPLII